VHCRLSEKCVQEYPVLLSDKVVDVRLSLTHHANKSSRWAE